MYRNYIKPTLDFVIALVVFVVTLPITLITIIITYLDLGLPIYNRRRRREGKGRKPFTMYKIRTKTLPTAKNGYKEEYTKVSRVIDNLRFNELPQLLNVIKGDMALVGPRPFIPDEKLPEGVISENRYKMKPGITGLAQINGGRTISHLTKLKYDDIYYNNMSFLEDFKIIVKTIYKLLFENIDK